jgi:photosystem II stability/assembly factor-like uncharacterized protein
MISTIRRPSFILPLALIGILLATPALLLAGQNSWTGSRPMGAQTDLANFIAADPGNPYVVYAAFEPDLYKSVDGGRTWTKLASFTSIYSLLVHPAEPSTLYLGAAPLDGSLAGIFKSTDSGLTWARSALSSSFHVFINALAGSPTDRATVYAGSGDGWVYTTADAGATWTRGQGLSGPISHLVVHPRESQVVYSGVDGSYYYFPFYEAGIARSSNAGSTWTYLASPTEFESVFALAIDSALYVGVGSASGPGRGLYRSDDDGFHWSRIGTGLPFAEYVSSLAVHPVGGLFAGTSYGPIVGVYRSGDSGETWTQLGPFLQSTSVPSIQLDGGGAVVYAGTDSGVHSYELAAGPIDVATGASGDSHLLSWQSNQLTVLTLDAAGNWSSTAPGDASTTWTAVAIASGTDGLARVLWQCVDGRSGIEIIGSAGRQAVFVFAPTGSLIPVDIAVAENGEARILFTGSEGEALVGRVDSSGALTPGPRYGPIRGWTAVAIADGPGGTRVLWRCTDGRGGTSLHDAGGVMLGSSVWPASAGYAAEDLAVGADGSPRLLRTNPNGDVEVSTIDAAGHPSAAQILSNSGFTPRRISAGADGKTRLLWNAADGSGSVWILNADNTVKEKHETPPEP